MKSALALFSALLCLPLAGCNSWPKEAFLLVALNTYAFYRKHHKDVRFVDLYEDAGFLVPDSALAPTPEASQFQRRFCAKSDGGVLADLPKEIADEMTFGLLSRLAKQ